MLCFSFLGRFCVLGCDMKLTKFELGSSHDSAGIAHQHHGDHLCEIWGRVVLIWLGFVDSLGHPFFCSCDEASLFVVVCRVGGCAPVGSSSSATDAGNQAPCELCRAVLAPGPGVHYRASVLCPFPSPSSVRTSRSCSCFERSWLAAVLQTQL